MPVLLNPRHSITASFKDAVMDTPSFIRACTDIIHLCGVVS